MWDERFLFVLSALFAIGMWVVVGLRHAAAKSGRSTTPLDDSRRLVVIVAILILAGHSYYHWRTSGLSYPGVGSVLAVLLGGAVGSFSARFVWSLFGARFGAKDPLIGVLALLILVIVYSLPVYRREISTLLGNVGLSSVKTPFVELSFTERPQLRSAVFSASKPSGDEHSSAISRPSDPRPGLNGLKHAVSE